MKELKQLMDSIDVDGNGKINYTEFLASSLEKDELFKMENLKKMFKLLDKDGNGLIEQSTILNVEPSSSVRASGFHSSAIASNSPSRPSNTSVGPL